MRRFELVIFDCDGVLVDSERITNTVFAERLNEIGLPVSLEDMFATFVGLSMPQCTAIIAEKIGGPLPEDFVKRYNNRTAAALRAHVTAVPGVVYALDHIPLPCCVASSGDHEKMRVTLGRTGLLPRFEGRIYSVTEVANPKPYPDIYLHAARKHHVDPSACVVIEDTPTGVMAGVAAGMTVLGYAASTPPVRLLAAGAHDVFSDMLLLPALLDRLSRSSMSAVANAY